MFPDMYALFIFERRHHLNVGVSRVFRAAMLGYISSGAIQTNWESMPSQLNWLVPVRKSVLHGCNTYIVIIKKNCRRWSLKLSFSMGKSSDLNVLSMNTGMRGLLEGKNFPILDIVFRFVALFIDRATELAEHTPMIRLHFTY